VRHLVVREPARGGPGAHGFEFGRRTDGASAGQVEEKRATAVITAYAVCAYTGKESSDYDLAGPIISPKRAGIAVSKDRQDLRGVIQAALQQIVDSGEYGQIFAKWGLASAALTSRCVNRSGYRRFGAVECE